MEWKKTLFVGKTVKRMVLILRILVRDYWRTARLNKQVREGITTLRQECHISHKPKRKVVEWTRKEWVIKGTKET